MPAPHRRRPASRRAVAAVALVVAMLAPACGMAATGGSVPPKLVGGLVAPPEPRRLTVAVAGDVLIHGAVAARARELGGGAHDFRPLFDHVRPIFAGADLALCHLETPVSPDNAHLSSYPVFEVPTEIVAALADAGFDGCSTASNHSLDRGAAGVAATLDVLDAAGLDHAGTARSAEEAAERTVYRVANVRVAHLAYTYGLNGFTEPAGQEWLVHEIDPATIVADAEAARAAGAEVVLVSLHWGVEYRAEPTADQDAVAAAVLASPAVDAVIGHHAHVVQPVERVGEKVVLYGLGNLISNQSADCCPAATQDGAIAVLTLAESAGRFVVEDVDIVPTWVHRPSYVVHDVEAALADPSTPGERRAALEASLARTVAVIAARGFVDPPRDAPHGPPTAPPGS